jgi:hypothetical protein
LYEKAAQNMLVILTQIDVRFKALIAVSNVQKKQIAIM